MTPDDYIRRSRALSDELKRVVDLLDKRARDLVLGVQMNSQLSQRLHEEWDDVASHGKIKRRQARRDVDRLDAVVRDDAKVAAAAAATRPKEVRVVRGRHPQNLSVI